MRTLRLITGSSQRHLLEVFADALRSSPPPPLENESIVVLSHGMSRWISMELASRLGVSAGLEFSFPNDLLDRCFRAVLPGAYSSTPFTRSSLTWRIASLLPSLSQQEGFEPIASYLGDGRDDRRTMQISRSIADCFDQYTIFRPEQILSWDNGNGRDWQALLWRAINHDCTGSHRAALLKALQVHVSHGVPPHRILPRRISLFGISYLPPFHLEALRLLSTYCDVTCYLLNPCGQYWGNILSKKKKSRLALQSTLSDVAEEYYETGNPLLSSLGTLGQEFFESLLDFSFEVEELEDPLQSGESAPPTLLATIQNDIITLSDRPALTGKSIVAELDRSLQFHSCHGPLREMEVLYDYLLARFDELPGLEPRHVVVMIPNIEIYAPYITSVFNSRSSRRPPLPYTIADRSIRRESQFVEAFLALIGSLTGRFALSEMLGLLETPAVMRRFAIDGDELVTIRTWLTDCSVRWGLDADHRAALGFPQYAEYSWQAGLDRLLLGYAMSPAGAGTFNSILPYPASTGQQAETLGKLIEFVSAVRESSARLSAHRTLTSWADALAAITARMLTPDESDTTGPLAVTKALNSLREASTTHGFTRTISLDAVRDHLTEALSKSGGGYGFMGGSITFCAMLPMRSIPMRVLWLAGMNDGEFPRTETPPGFSLMNGPRKRGDRSVRDEDRYLFLEALMAAEDCLCISYNGQNSRDNSAIPPSILVTELLDYVTNGFVGPDGVTPAAVLVRHRLQGFSPLYFNGSDPAHYFSYDRESCLALEAGRINGLSGREFLRQPLPFDRTVPREINLQSLARFLANPCAAFLEQRLRVTPLNRADEPDDTEPFALDSLSRYSLSQELIGQLLNGADFDSCLAAARSRGVLPPLSTGRAVFEPAWEVSRQFTETIKPHLGTPLESLSVQFTHGTLSLTAVIENCRSGTHLRWRCAGLKGKDRLSIWLEHLLLNVAQAVGYPVHSRMIASDSVLELLPVERAADILADLMELYCEGMQRPLRFFPETSWAISAGEQQKAESSWFGDQRRSLPGECDNQAVSLCFGREEPWGEELQALAERVYGPLIAAVKCS